MESIPKKPGTDAPKDLSELSFDMFQVLPQTSQRLIDDSYDFRSTVQRPIPESLRSVVPRLARAAERNESNLNGQSGTTRYTDLRDESGLLKERKRRTGSDLPQTTAQTHVDGNGLRSAKDAGRGQGHALRGISDEGSTQSHQTGDSSSEAQEKPKSTEVQKTNTAERTHLKGSTGRISSSHVAGLLMLGATILGAAGLGEDAPHHQQRPRLPLPRSNEDK